MEQNECILDMHDISKSFPGVHALKNVSFRVKKGSVHALMGENGAGKSTLMKVLTGLYQADGGTITYDGRQISKYDQHAALQMGITIVHQELSYVPHMTVAENMYLGREIVVRGFTDKKKMIAGTKELLAHVGVTLDPRRTMYSLSVSERQMVEIAKCVSYNAKIVVMDEPTSAITDKEVEQLFVVINELKAKGVAIVYISHKMDEVLRIADQVTVLRDGAYIDTFDAADIDIGRVIMAMVGRELSEVYPEKHNQVGDPVLEVRGLHRAGVFEDISFHLKKGEILGFSGLMGAGRTEVMRALYGLDKLDGGEVLVGGKRVKIKGPEDAIRHKIGLVSEDRKGIGLVLTLSVKKNLTLSNLNKYFRGAFIQDRKESSLADRMIGSLSIKTPGRDQLVRYLSGGNQQKVVLGKLLLDEAEILILDEPTRGIDIAAKAEIYRLICRLAEEGRSILFISSEMPEIMGLCDRIIVLHEGRITGELDRSEFSQETIMKLAIAQ